jgi:hypothetical protein
MNETTDDRVIWRQDLQVQMHVCSETMRRYIRDHKVPPPDVAISRQRMGWRLSTLRAAGINLA